MVILMSVSIIGCGSAWPENWSKDLPEFQYGHVSAVEQNFMEKELGQESVSLSEFESDALAKYKNDIVNAGWSIVSETDAYFSAQKNGHVVTVLIGSMDGINIGSITYSD